MDIDWLLRGDIVPLWLKLGWTAMTLAIVVVYWAKRGPANFLWFSDIALLGLVPGLWLESSFVVSLLACAVLVPELLWSVSFFGRLTGLPRLTGIADYMFEEQSPLWLRAVSLFHVPLLAMLLWAPWRLGYDAAVYPRVVLLTWLLLLLTRLLTKPAVNINHVYRLPLQMGRDLSPVRHMTVLMLAMPLALQLPAHLLLSLLFA